jgi:hypothetical protein
MRRVAFGLCGALALVALGPAPAQDDIASRIINQPGAPQLNGARARLRDDAAVQGGKAIRVEVPGKGANVWDVAAESRIDKPVKAGDSLLFAFWVRLEKGEGGATTATLPFNGVQLSAAPYTTVFAGPVEIGPEWKLSQVTGKAERDYPAGTLKAVIHLATGKQTVDLGPLFVVNLGQQ